MRRILTYFGRRITNNLYKGVKVREKHSINKLALFDFPDLFVFVDRICPVCGSPVSVKLVNGVEIETCLNSGCPYVKVEGEGGETPLEH